ncbi:MAG: FAD-dependent oxidoreductase [Fimbriimonadaceae bacterium]|nr:FAD-dependent oxidoreductase [Chthonomonadaceae bacterium]MCO5297699.1 FAD-dependent oxidoreductase [Fimbriimonadaceae bacterium]
MSRVVVIGAGIVGLCSAREMVRRGHEVAVIDRGARDQHNCSWGNLGMIVPSHFEPLAAPGMVGYGLRMLANPESPFGFHVPPSPALLAWAWRFWRAATSAHVERASPVLARMHLASLDLTRDLLKELGGDFGFVEHGLLTLCKTAARLDAEAALAEHGRAFGMTVDVLDRAALREREPGVDMDVVGAVHYRNDAHLEPGLLTEALVKDLEARGVCFHWSTDALGFEQDGSDVRAVRTSAGIVEGDRFVVAGGVESEGLAAELGVRIPLVGGKGYTMTVEDPPQLPKASVILAEARVAATPMRGAFRIGGTMEIGAGDLSVSHRRVAGIRRSFCDYFPAFSEATFAGVPVWAGRRPLTPDGLPCLGVAPRFSNCAIACGHAMMGFSLGAVSGRLVAQLLEGEPHAVPLDLFGPDRFG